MKGVIVRLMTSRPASALFRMILGSRVAIFMLHRFREPGTAGSGCDPEHVRALLSEVRSRGVQILSVWEVMDGLAHGRPVRGLCFTVDDGYQDFIRFGAPVFREFDCPVALFLATGFIDGDYWYWWDKIKYAFWNTPLKVLDLPFMDRRLELDGGNHRRELARLVSARIKDLPQAQRSEGLKQVLASLEVQIPSKPTAGYEPLRWEQIRSLHDSGFDFGPHGVKHLSFNTADPTDVQEEVRGSFARLQEMLPNPLPVFCYPYGTRDDVSNRVAAIVEKEGMAGALTAIPGYTQTGGGHPTRRFLIPRFVLPEDPLAFGQIAYGLERGKEIYRHVMGKDTPSLSSR